MLLAAGVLFALAFAADLQQTERDDSPQAAQARQRLQEQLAQVQSEAQRLMVDSLRWHRTALWFYEWHHDKLTRWSTHAYLPEASELRGDFGLKVIHTGRGVFVLQKWVLADGRTMANCLPLYQEFKVKNQYLKPRWNAAVFGAWKPRVLEASTANGWPLEVPGQGVLCKLQSSATDRVASNSLALGLWAAGVVVFMLAVAVLCQRFHRAGYHGRVFVWALAGVVVLRCAMIYARVPARWWPSPVFDPERFASSWYNPSLGDLLINALVVVGLCLYLFLYYPRVMLLRNMGQADHAWRWLGSVFALTAAYFALLFPYLFAETIFHNSGISLDITQSLAVDSLRVLALLAVVLGALASFFVLHVLMRLVGQQYAKQKLGFWLALIAATALFVLYHVLADRPYGVVLLLGAVFFSFLFITGFTRSLRFTTHRTFLYLFSYVVVFSVLISFGIRKFVEEERYEDQVRFASTYLADRDQLAEYLLNEAAQRIREDNFIIGRMANAFLSKEPVRQKISRYYLGSYFDQYDLSVLMFSSLGEPLGNRYATDLSDWLVSIQSQVQQTNYPGLYFFAQTGRLPARKYFNYIPIRKGDVLVGFIALDLTQKRIIPRQVFPELLLDERFSAYLRNKDYSYVFFAGGNVVRHFGHFNYERDFDKAWIGDPQLYRHGIGHRGHFHVAVEDENGATAVVTGRAYSRFDLLANFAAYFIVGLLLMVAWIILLVIRAWRAGTRLNYSTRIQLYVSLAFVLPLLIVSYTLQQSVSRANDRQLKSTFENEARSLGDQLASWINAAAQDSLTTSLEITGQLNSLARLAGVDATVFYPDGTLWASSQPMIYDQHFIAPVVNPIARVAIVGQAYNELTLDESIGSLSYNTAYVALRSSASGSLIGYLSIPFFDSRVLYERSQVVVLANILIIFTLVFIFFSILSYFAAGWLTFPLRFISARLGRTTLSGENQPIEWKSQDEIGRLVQEYNAMLLNLEKSKTDLARSQKENAWREIAQQVAHEIKNPLTPMKLTLQQMQLRQELSDEKTKQSLQTLLTQVNALNEIASSFSAFARMPAPILQKLELNELVRKTVLLYQMHPQGRVSFSSALTEAWVMADEQVLTRAVSNLVLNALQSGIEGEPVTVVVRTARLGSVYEISVDDNGQGIAPDFQDKVFLPHFSTKRAGSGLGLAIVKQGIEQSHGSIFFRTEPGKGTTFFIRLNTIA